MALTATLALSSDRVVRPAGLDLDVEIRNGAPQPVRFSTATLRGSVAFEVLDDGGRRLPLGPPPVPPADLAAGLVTLEPGAALALRFHGDELFPDPPPAGSYRVRFAGTTPPLPGAWSGRIESPWVELRSEG